MDSINTPTQIRKLGLGCVTFGREIDKRMSFDLMNYAYEKGITFFDTAAAYGSGSSEQIVGAWFKVRPSLKSSVVVATKILPPYDLRHINLSVEESLRRLNAEAIDVLYLHRWDEILHQSEAWTALDKLVKDGKVKELGVSNFDSRQLARALIIQKHVGAKELSYIQNNHNLAVSDIDENIKTICKENDIKVVTFSPLGAGFLTGKHLQGVQQGSRFADMPAHQAIYFNAKSQKRLKKLLQVAERTGYSPAHLALSWAIHQPCISSVLVGGRTIAHLDQAFNASTFHSSEIFTELESAG